MCGCPGDLLDAENFGKLFLSFFLTVFCREFKSREGEIQAGWKRRNALSIPVESDNVVTIPCPHYGVEIKNSAYLLPRASRLKSRRVRAIFFREQL